MNFKEAENMIKVGFLKEYPVVFTKLEDDVLEGEMDITQKALNPYGAAHGAIGYGFADTIAGGLCFSHGDNVVTADGSIYYSRPLVEGKALGQAKYVRRGKRNSVVDVSIFQNDKICIKATFTMAVVNRPLVNRNAEEEENQANSL